MDTLEQYVDIYMFCLGRRNMVDAVYSSDYEKPHKVNISITNKISCTEMILQNGTRKKIIEYDICPHREYLVEVSHKVKSFQ